ncbi:outer membrane protein assembly factor BamE [Aestuariispira ectoiniformans]|uniref:outer membrane protein assembly factor BamE n=1 Tax=Aestuariispira ectoiniformans TaxID=2775080 RepID=UPI00223BCA92|nr:outer membrane protein assembly factor BamE [Aestuariispira ectoiniformans]
MGKMSPLTDKTYTCGPKQALKAFVAATGLALAVAGCSPKVAIRGNLPLPSQMEQVHVGSSNKAEVQRLLGSPSTVGTFDSQTWYYMSQRKEQWAFFEPEIVDHQVLVLYFDDRGILQQMQHYTKDDLRKIALQERVTPTSGHSLGFIEQLLGNVGRFSPGQGSK